MGNSFEQSIKSVDQPQSAEAMGLCHVPIRQTDLAQSNLDLEEATKRYVADQKLPNLSIDVPAQAQPGRPATDSVPATRPPGDTTDTSKTTGHERTRQADLVRQALEEIANPGTIDPKSVLDSLRAPGVREIPVKSPGFPQPRTDESKPGLGGERSEPRGPSDSAQKPETPEQKESRELSEKNLDPALNALKDFNIEKLCEIGAKLKGNPEALRKLEDTLTKKLGIGIFFNNEGVALWKTQTSGTDSITTTVGYKADGKPSFSMQSVSSFHRDERRDNEIKVKDAEAIISSEVAKAFKSKT